MTHAYATAALVWPVLGLLGVDVVPAIWLAVAFWLGELGASRAVAAR